MASEEMTLGGWQNSVTKVQPPRIRWRSTPSTMLALVTIVFVTTCFLLPDWMVTVAITPPLNVDQDVDQLAEQIETLEEELIIEPPEAQEL